MHGVLWVDDFFFYSQVAWHAACAGLAGGCPVCLVLDAWWIELCGLLGVPLNMEKHQRCAQKRCAQTVEYSGFLFDSFRWLMLALEDKQQLRQPDGRWSQRELDSIFGSMLHYSVAIRHLRVRRRSPVRRTGDLSVTRTPYG